MLEEAKYVRKKVEGDAGMSTMVSIYLLLLGFLAVVYSFSTHQVGRAGAVMNSINSAFDKSGEISNQNQNINQQDVPSITGQNLLEDVEGLLRENFTFEGNNFSNNGDFLEVKLEANEFFTGVSEHVRPDLGTFLAGLNNLANKPTVSEGLKIEFIFATGEPRGVKMRETARKDLAIKRAESLSQAFTDLDFPGSSFGAGLKTGPSNIITIRFRADQNLSSRLSQGQGQ